MRTLPVPGLGKKLCSLASEFIMCRYTCQVNNTGTDMQDFLVDLAAVIIICSPIVAIIAFGIYKGDFSRVSEPPSPPSELELRERANQTMLRHERRELYERIYIQSKCNSELLKK